MNTASPDACARASENALRALGGNSEGYYCRAAKNSAKAFEIALQKRRQF